jgi:hypothetical protein
LRKNRFSAATAAVGRRQSTTKCRLSPSSATTTRQTALIAAVIVSVIGGLPAFLEHFGFDINSL